MGDQGVRKRVCIRGVAEFETHCGALMVEDGDLSDVRGFFFCPGTDEEGEVTGHGGWSGKGCGRGAKTCDLIEDDLCEVGFGADGAGVGEFFLPQMVGIVPEHVPLTGGGAGL